MTVYFAQARTDQSTVKIGFTSDLASRQKNLSVSTPGGVVILATLQGNKDTEEYLHEKFADDRLGGEWFRCSDPLRDFIRDVQNGKPGLIPFRDEAVYMRRGTAEYSEDAVVMAKRMATEIVNAELRGFRDTAEAARARIEQRFGLRSTMLRRLLYKEMNDVTAGVFLHLKEIHERLCQRVGPAGEGMARASQSASEQEMR
jgi:hypothetical protein